ncbi:hypothetical protein TNIN_182371 [Trichonephila inaurata madagascariensis]|uniref:Uncharacterized protein n=1 Tax=Trichonephila inaurata madagascariensis TaxID=2747483 RepID=A0A8X6YDK4_9ARAC|nr:hypothetical protein TNIN_182371 [Trichonephila inaurata madagascariensis]
MFDLLDFGVRALQELPNELRAQSRKEQYLALELGEVLWVIELANVMQDIKHYSDDVAKGLLKTILNIKLEEQKKWEREQERIARKKENN